MYKVYTGISGVPGAAGQILRQEIRDLHQSESVQQELSEIASNIKTFKITHKQTKYTGIGAFNGSRKVIPVGTKIGWYMGKIRIDDKHTKQNAYLLSLPRRVWFRKTYKLLIDGDCKKELKDVNNLCRFNHSCKPNCPVVRIKGPGKLYYVVSVVKIPALPGRELVWDYGPGYWNNRIKSRKFRVNRIKSKKLIDCQCKKSKPCPKGRTYSP